jgi:hypothetical protein
MIADRFKKMTPEEREKIEAERKLVKEIIELYKFCARNGISLDNLETEIVWGVRVNNRFAATFTLTPDDDEDPEQDI